MRRVVPAVALCCLLAALVPAAVAGQRVPAPTTGARLVLPSRAAVIRMDHALPDHRALRCERCHTGASRSGRASDELSPQEESCAPCHIERMDRRRRSERRCGFCHLGLDAAAAVVPALSPRPARLLFSHARHSREGVLCLDCHEGLTAVDRPGAAHLPTMRSCLRCHGGPSAAAPSACVACHVRLPDGRMRTRFREGVLLPPPWLRGTGHDGDWIVRHRWVGADEGPLCATCHTENECAACHDGRVRSPRVHPNDWLTVHPQMARRAQPRCTSCHQAQSFCAECHARLGISPMAAPNVRAIGRFHPPPETWIRGPTLHGREARRSMNTCTSCHAETDCVSCHGVLGIGAGRNPHPAGFGDDCRRLLRQNDRACRTCHGDLASVAARCR